MTFFILIFFAWNMFIPVGTINLTAVVDTAVSCGYIPSHQNIDVWSVVTGIADGLPQREIYALNIRSV